MVLRRKKDGSFSINSGRSVHDALERKDKIAAELEQAEEELMQTKIGQKIRRLREEADALTEAVNAYILRKYEPGEGYEDEHWKVTKVQSHRRKWNPDTLKRLIPHGLWKRCIKVEVVPAKVDALRSFRWK